jgi:hypothetical protein
MQVTYIMPTVSLTQSQHWHDLECVKSGRFWRRVTNVLPTCYDSICVQRYQPSHQRTGFAQSVLLSIRGRLQLTCFKQVSSAYILYGNTVRFTF